MVDAIINEAGCNEEARAEPRRDGGGLVGKRDFVLPAIALLGGCGPEFKRTAIDR